MKIDREKKAIVAYRHEQFMVCNYLAHCTGRNENWKVTFITSTGQTEDEYLEARRKK